MNDISTIVGLIGAVGAAVGALAGFALACWQGEIDRQDAYNQGLKRGFKEGCDRINRFK